jgi:glycosyltransferase involved in cell wall biosynthesis
MYLKKSGSMMGSENLKMLCIISELISFPFDEGLKNIAYQLMSSISKKRATKVITKKNNDTHDLCCDKVNLNKLFLNYGLSALLRKYKPGIILYIPEASCTLNSFIRARVLKVLFPGARIVMLAAQHRKFAYLSKVFLPFARPDLLFLFNDADKLCFENMGFSARLLPPAVDSLKFCQVEPVRKRDLRVKYDLPLDKTIVLHVGHIRPERNLECLLSAGDMQNIQLLIVGSTSMRIDEDLRRKLVSRGIIVLDRYLPDIHEIYQLSDVYVFPVLKYDAAIDIPLSILEALACNLPVVTTRFGSLPDYFREGGAFKYFDKGDELAEKIGSVVGAGSNLINNREMVKNFTWNKVADDLMDACEKMI